MLSVADSYAFLLWKGQTNFDIIAPTETSFIKKYVQSVMYGLAANTIDSSSGFDGEWTCVYQINGCK